MDDMIIPEEIIFMRNTVYPVTCKIKCDECNKVCKESSLNLCDCYLVNQPGIGDDGKAQSQNIFCGIGNPRTQAGNHIHIADSVHAFSPALPFFKQDQHKKCGHGNQ